MKLKIEKPPHGQIRIELTHDTSKKPIVLVIEKQHLPFLATMIDTAQRSESSSISLVLELS